MIGAAAKQKMMARMTGVGDDSPVRRHRGNFRFNTISALVLDPLSGAVLFAATAAGEVLRSADGGASWTPSGSGLPPEPVMALAFDPLHTNTLFAATAGAGVFRTRDGGLSWDPVNDGLTTLEVDVLAGRPTEIEYITGHLLRVAQQHGVAVPHNEAIYTRIIDLQEHPRP